MPNNINSKKLNQKTVKITAIVSTYNSERFIRGRLDDLVAQTIFSEMEVIVVNSGSRQNEDSIIKEYIAIYPNIRYIKTEERESIYKAWNRGIREAHGRYITNCNADDRLRIDALEILSNYLDSNSDVAMVYADQYVSGIPNETYLQVSKSARKQRWNNFSIERLLEASLAGPQPMWRSGLHFVDNLWFDEELDVAGDYEFACHVAMKYKLKHIPELLGVYYLSESQQNKEYQNSLTTSEENHIVKERYSRVYLEAISPEKFYKRYNYYLKWGKANIGLFYFWKLLVKVINSDKRLPTREFTVWFASKFAEHVGNISIAMKYCSDYLEKKDSFLIRKQIERLESSKKIKSGMISVIVPTYNRRHLLVDALDSLTKQTYKNFEVIVVNNGSEPIDDAIALYQNKLKICLLTSDLKGSVSHAKNLGVKHSKGELIAYLDDDDWYHPVHLERLMEEISRNDNMFVYSDAQVELQELKDGEYKTVKKYVEYSKEFNRSLLLVKDYIFTPCVLHYKRCFEFTGGFDEILKTDEDMDLWIRMSRFYKFKHLPEVTCSVRRTNNASQLTKDWGLMYKNAQYVYAKHKDMRGINLFIYLGQQYYLNLRKKRAKENLTGNNRYY